MLRQPTGKSSGRPVSGHLLLVTIQKSCALLICINDVHQKNLLADLFINEAHSCSRCIQFPSYWVGRACNDETRRISIDRRWEKKLVCRTITERGEDGLLVVCPLSASEIDRPLVSPAVGKCPWRWSDRGTETACISSWQGTLRNRYGVLRSDTEHVQTRSLLDGSKWAIVPIEEQEHNNCWSSSNSDLFELDDDERQRDVVELQLHAERI